MFCSGATLFPWLFVMIANHTCARWLTPLTVTHGRYQTRLSQLAIRHADAAGNATSLPPELGPCFCLRRACSWRARACMARLGAGSRGSLCWPPRKRAGSFAEVSHARHLLMSAVLVPVGSFLSTAGGTHPGPGGTYTMRKGANSPAHLLLGQRDASKGQRLNCKRARSYLDDLCVITGSRKARAGVDRVAGRVATAQAGETSGSLPAQSRTDCAVARLRIRLRHVWQDVAQSVVGPRAAAQEQEEPRAANPKGAASSPRRPVHPVRVRAPIRGYGPGDYAQSGEPALAGRPAAAPDFVPELVHSRRRRFWTAVGCAHSTSCVLGCLGGFQFAAERGLK